jgi:hypothetical protein
MKYLLFFLITVHGLIHLMGFAKAFQLANFDQLQVPISQPVGVLWLVAAGLLLASAVMLFVLPAWWWVPALGGLVLSQSVIATSWSDAKFGTIANIIVLVPVMIAALGHAPWSFHTKYDHDVANGLAAAPPTLAVVTEADIAHLPPIVQKYMHFTGVIGKPQVANYRVEFSGALRSGPNDAWMPMVAHQQSFVEPAERLFLVDANMFGLPTSAYHRYSGPSATFEVKVAELVKVVDARGPEMNQSETVTLFNDMCLFAPATLIDRDIRWEELDPLTVRATFSNAGHTVSAVLSFDQSGGLTNFVSDDRSRTIDGKTYEQVRWSTPIQGWRSVDGYTVPDAEARWLLPSGEFAYGRFEIRDVTYNVAR